MEIVPKITLNKGTEHQKILTIEEVKYSILEISPSRLTSNTNVKWLLAEFSRLFKPLEKRIKVDRKGISITPELNVWWEVFINKGKIQFYLVVPDKDNVKDMLKRQIMKTWKQSNVREIGEYLPDFDSQYTAITKLSLEKHSVLSLQTSKPDYSPLDSFLNTKHYLKDDDMALLQIGMRPTGNGWNKGAEDTFDKIKRSGFVPRKKGKALSPKEIIQKLLYVIGLVSEELFNLLGDFLIPGWEEDRGLLDSQKSKYGEADGRITRNKVRSDGFRTDIRIVASSKDPERRASIMRSMSSGFDPLEGDNKLVGKKVSKKMIPKELKKIKDRKLTVKINGDVLCSLELSKMINVPDRKAQIEHYNELSLVNHRGETDVPKEIFKDEGSGIPFAVYEDSDGEDKTVYFSAKDHNLLCMPRIIIGEPGTGKTTFAQNFALDVFERGYGAFIIDASDGKMVQRILDRVKPKQRDKVKIIDFLDTENPIGLGWNEIFRSRNTDVVEDIVVEEVLAYIELVAHTELNMRARQWVENAVKAVFITPDATLLDVENMLNNKDYRERVIPGIEDPELRTDWLYFHQELKSEDRRTIYNEAFRRLSPVMRKRTLKNFILQSPKKDSKGNYLLDIRKWMDEGYLVLVKANETLGETLQTALISFMLSKFNLAMISREDVREENDRIPCFLILDEPDHYIRGSERWRNMLTRYRKYRCGLTFMFHGWAQMKKEDKNLPDIMRQAGPHYVIFQTDEKNLEELKSVIQPEFKISDIAKGMPQHHAVIKIKMYSSSGDSVPAFMAKGLGRTEDLYEKYDNDDLYVKCSKELGRPKKEVMEAIFKYKTGAEVSILEDVEIDSEGSGEIIQIEEEEGPVPEIVKKKIYKEVEEYLEYQIDNGEEPDMDLVEHMDEILGEDKND